MLVSVSSRAIFYGLRLCASWWQLILQMFCRSLSSVESDSCFLPCRSVVDVPVSVHILRLLAVPVLALFLIELCRFWVLGSLLLTPDVPPHLVVPFLGTSMKESSWLPKEL